MATFNIYDFDDLKDVRNHLADDCVVQNNIDGGGADFGAPIGTQLAPFTGTFEGGGYDIENFTCTGGDSDDFAAWWGYTDATCTIRDFYLIDVDITHTITGPASTYYNGALATIFYNMSGILEDIIVQSCDIEAIGTDTSDPCQVRAFAFTYYCFAQVDNIHLENTVFAYAKQANAAVGSTYAIACGFSYAAPYTTNSISECYCECDWNYQALCFGWSYFGAGEHLCSFDGWLDCTVNGLADSPSAYLGGFTYVVAGEVYSCWV